MVDFVAVRDELMGEVEQLAFEVDTLWRGFKATDWHGNQRHFPYAHYGYLMATFARIDLVSRYCAGYDRPQTRRMIAFLNRYVHPGSHEANGVAVQMWRHSLMHTGEGRRQLDLGSGKRYTWRLDFSPETLGRPHYTIYRDGHDGL
jgi:hypothetical protein